MARRRKSVVPEAPGIAERRGQVDWKLLFNQLFALEIKKEHVLGAGRPGGAEALDRLLEAYTYYTPETFNEALERIGGTETSEEAYEARVAFYQDPANRRLISDLDLRRCVGEGLRRREAVRSFLDVVWRHRDRPITEGESFFDSPEGRNVERAFAFDGGANAQEVALVLVPGFAGHTIKYPLFEEMQVDANLHHGRPAERPLLREEGIDLEFESHREYYARGDAGEGSFDILQPAGTELGNTTGSNAETTDLLHDWVRSLPERYARKKLLLFGYSKGAPIILAMPERHPELSPRILGYVTYCGVVQGTHVAGLALEVAESILREVPIGDFIDRLREEEPARLGRVLSPLFADLDLSWLSVPRIRAVFDALGFDVAPLEGQVDRVLRGREVRELLDGARDLSAVERTRWNLRELTSEVFRDPVAIFNVSALTDVQDFVRPVGLRADDPGGRSLLAPVLTAEGKVDWRHLSLDALFLYFTSIEGFKTAPGGLYDTQVELAHTKSPTLDRRPLSASLTADEIASLWTDRSLRRRWKRCGIESAEALAEVPRAALFPADERETIAAIDLGELRGHHWSPLVQALRPPPELSTDYARWDFPRKAFMRALVQLLAFENLVRNAPDATCATEATSTCIEPAGAAPDEDRDVVFFRTDGVTSARREIVNLYNLAARAAAYGIVVNSARTGLGTSPVTGHALQTESLYYQGLRLYTAADAEFRRGLLEDPTVWPLPRTLVALIGRFPGRFASSYPEEPVELLAEVHRALTVIDPGVKPFELRRLAPGDYVIRSGSRRVVFAPAVRDALWRGTRARLEAMERDAYGESATAEARLRAMLSAFTPLATLFSASIDSESPEESSTATTVYLPPYHTLHAEDLDRPASWVLEKGLKNLALPRPVRLAAAELTHLRYLSEADPSATQGIKLEVLRDYRGDDRITTVASFGRLFEGSAEELLGLDTSNRRDALHVVFRPSFAHERDEAPADGRFKDTFNRVFGPFEVEAQVHRIALRMRRRAREGGGSHDDGVLGPSFVVEDSSISFRVNRYVDTTVEHLPLQAAGFTVREAAGGPHRFHCWRDFWTWDQLRDEFFYGRRPGSDRASLPTHLRGRLLEGLVGTATRAAVDRAIESIEDALDSEIARIADDSLKRYTKARTVLVDRLHDGLF